MGSLVNAAGVTVFEGEIVGGALAAVGPFVVTAAEVVAGWDTDHGDVTTGYTLPAGAIIYDVIYRVTEAFDSDNVNSMFPFVGASNAPEIIGPDPSNTSDPLVDAGELETGTLLLRAQDSPGGSSASPHSVLAIAGIGNNGTLPAVVATATPLRFRFGVAGVATAQPNAGRALWYLLLLAPSAP